MIFPVLWMLLISLKETPESLNTLLEVILSDYKIANYSDALKSDSFDIYFVNSLFVSIIVTIGNILFCTVVAYSLARRKNLFNNLLFITVIGVMMIPPHVIMIPLYRLMVNFSWINTYYALIIPWLVTPFGIFLLRQYISKIPEEIENAARIDGAGNFYILFKIIFPLSKPAIIVLSVYIFLMNWNSFLFPLLFINDSDLWTLPVGLSFYLGKQSIDWGHLMAGASMSAIPIILLFLIFQKQIIKGLTSGAIKE